VIGRADEQAALAATVRRARRGRAGTVVVVGGAGVGKTTLLDRARELASDFRLLSVRGVESEAELAFAGLAELLRPLAHLVGELPGPQADALAGVLAVGPPVPAARFAVGVATLSLLAAAAEDGPVLVAVDDAHWLDSASLEALTFAVRRLHAEPVAVVIVTRPGDSPVLDGTDLPRIHVGGLAGEQLRVLITERLGRAVAAEVAEALSSLTDGNPLLSLDLAASLEPTALAGLVDLPDGLSRPQDAATVLERRLGTLPAPTRRALGVAAADRSGSVDVIRFALAGLDLLPSDLEAAEAAGIVRSDGLRVHFAHPLLRAAAYELSSPIDRRRAHRVIADAPGLEPVGRAWHLANAAEGPDEAIATALEEGALDAHALGGVTSAAIALERAAMLTPTAHERSRRLVAAAGAMLAAGRLERVRRYLDEALAADPSPPVRADAMRLRGQLLLVEGAPARALELLRDEGERIAAHDAARAASMLLEAAVPAVPVLAYDVALDASRRAYELAAPGSPTRDVAAVHLAFVLLLTGRPEAALPLLDEADPSSSGSFLHPSSAVCHSIVGRYDEALALLEEAIVEARLQATLLTLPIDLAVRSLVQYLTGAWASSLASSTESIHLAGTTGQLPVRGYALTSLARLDAVQGRETSCRAHAAEAIEVAAYAGDIVWLHAEGALGLLELGAGRPAEAAAHLGPVVDRFRAAGGVEPTMVLHGADHVEALARSGRRAEAEDELDHLEDSARRTLQPLVAGRGPAVPHPARRCGRCVGARACRRSARRHQRRPVRAGAGTALRRRAARRPAPDRGRVLLERSMRTFRQLGAAPWCERARGRPRRARPTGRASASDRRAPDAPRARGRRGDLERS
jgi:tetratricopeptide (TPR) repeat protein